MVTLHLDSLSSDWGHIALTDFTEDRYSGGKSQGLNLVAADSHTTIPMGLTMQKQWVWMALQTDRRVDQVHFLSAYEGCS